MKHPIYEQLKTALQKCEDAWQAAGAKIPCYEENYMKAREEYHSLLIAAGMLDKNYRDKVPT